MEEYVNRFYCQDSRKLSFIPDDKVSLVVTSPMYLGAGVKYNTATDMMPLPDYLDLHRSVWGECYRVTEPGGRIAVVVANTGRKPYVNLAGMHVDLLLAAGYMLKGMVVWDKGPTFGTAWGSWLRPTSPELRDIHEFIIVAQKPGKKLSKGFGDMVASEFTEATQSIWHIQPASAKKVGHPAPFPVELPSRLIKLYTYTQDLVLDPFMGAGTTCLAAELLCRQWIGVDMDPAYCALADKNMNNILGELAASSGKGE